MVWYCSFSAPWLSKYIDRTMNAVVRWSYGIKCSPDFSTSLSRGVFFFFFFLRDSEKVMSDLAWRQNGLMSVSVKSARICLRRNCWHTGNNLTPGISESRHCLGGKGGGWGDDVILCMLTACCVIARFMHSSSSCLFLIVLLEMIPSGMF